jgi:hypothetical protein
VHRSRFFYGVELGCYVPVRSLLKNNKEDKYLVDVAQGGGIPRTCCVSILCAMC